MIVVKPVIGTPGRTVPKKERSVNSDADALALIRASFAGQEKLIERVFGESRSFKTLCEDYRRCNEALQRFKQLATAESALRSQEYGDLLVELGQEIRAWLEAMEPCSSHSSRETDDF